MPVSTAEAVRAGQRRGSLAAQPDLLLPKTKPLDEHCLRQSVSADSGRGSADRIGLTRSSAATFCDLSDVSCSERHGKMSFELLL